MAGYVTGDINLVWAAQGFFERGHFLTDTDLACFFEFFLSFFLFQTKQVGFFFRSGETFIFLSQSFCFLIGQYLIGQQFNLLCGSFPATGVLQQTQNVFEIIVSDALLRFFYIG